MMSAKYIPLASGADGCTYYSPDVRGRVQFDPWEFHEEVERLGDLETMDFGLRGLRIPDRLKHELSGEYRGLDWHCHHPNNKKKRNLALQSACRTRWQTFKEGWQEDHQIFKFCIHPKSLEFFGDATSPMHAIQVRLYGSRPFEEYCRLAHVQGTILTRAFYNPQRQYDPDADKRTTLKVLAILHLNGMPYDTNLVLSAGPQVLLEYGVR